jgi:phenylacetate-coenzyme A ligase PaaK-like adenylate-forming protein
LSDYKHVSAWRADKPPDDVAPEDPKAAYDHLRAAHLNAVRASLEDHMARLEWLHQRIEHYRTERLRSLLAFARERSPFHAARMADIDPATATVEDLVRLPPMLKQEAQDDWDAIVTSPISTAPAPSGCWHSSAGSPTPPRNTRCSAQAAQAVCAVCRYGIGSSS